MRAQGKTVFPNTGPGLNQSIAALSFSASPKLLYGRDGVIRVSVCLETSRALTCSALYWGHKPKSPLVGGRHVSGNSTPGVSNILK